MSAIRKQHYLTFLLLIRVSLVGCKQQSKSEGIADKGISRGSDQNGYLHADGYSVMFIRWTEINNKLNGQLSVFYEKGGRGKVLIHHHIRLRGYLMARASVLISLEANGQKR
jgi:hypothetical protein